MYQYSVVVCNLHFQRAYMGIYSPIHVFQKNNVIFMESCSIFKLLISPTTTVAACWCLACLLLLSCCLCFRKMAVLLESRDSTRGVWLGSLSFWSRLTAYSSFQSQRSLVCVWTSTATEKCDILTNTCKSIPQQRSRKLARPCTRVS